jgi:glycosyltransferase involved in cell wall biosynthesis
LSRRYIRTSEKPLPLMRIGLDVHVLTGPHQGTTSVWMNLLNHLPPTHEYVLYSFDPYEVNRRFPQAHFIHRRIPRIPAAARIQIAFPFMTRRDRCDVFHANYYGPIVGGPPLVLHVHDVIYLDFPEYSTGVRSTLFATLSRASAHAARRVVTDSEWSRDRIVAQYGIRADRVDVVPLGLGDEWHHPSEKAIANAWIGLQSRVPRRFALSVGRLDPRKNLAQTARVVRTLVDRGLLGGLVIVGPEDFGASQIRAEIARDGNSPIVTHLSGVDTASLQALYRNSSCLLYLSLAEGFGLPLIEAMAMGVPIVASNRTSIPEVVGEAGLIVDPENIADAVNAVVSILSSPELRESMIARGKERLKHFDGEMAAARMIDVYTAAVTGNV